LKITFRNVTHEYGNGIAALREIKLTIEKGSSVLLVGRNGAGKSTLLKHLNGILKPTMGDVLLDDVDTRSHDTSDLARYVALAFQNPDDQIFATTVKDEVSFGPENLGKENAPQLTQDALALLGLRGFSSSHPYDLHPSKRKLIAIASAIAMDTPIIALDEPNAGLDLRQANILRRTLEELKRRRKTLIIVSHDLDFFLPYCNAVVMLKEGRLTFEGTATELAAREEVRELLRDSGLRIPILWRMARFLRLEAVPSAPEDFAKLLLDKKRL
jgi:energy-coupling factor transporter ATP-binding protein EcfA2